MPYYPMRCTFEGCGLEFDYYTKPDLYRVSQSDGFRDIRCKYCGSFGNIDRAWPADSAPANLTVKGTWGKHASPELKGREFYTKQERDRQLSAVGQTPIDDGSPAQPKKSRTATTYTRSEDGKIEPIVKVAKRVARPVVIDERIKRPSDLIRDYAADNEGLVDFAGLAEATGIDKRKLQGGVMSALRSGWLEKTGEKRVYRVL